MKTSVTQPLQFSGYPLANVVAKEEEKRPASRATGERDSAVPLAKAENLLDIPENWDETWFANYE